MTSEAVDDFFISYVQADWAWAEWVAWQLEDEGWTTVLQAGDFRPDDDGVARMRDALQQADRTILLLSPTYLASPSCADAWIGAFLRDKRGAERLLPVRVEACELPSLLATHAYVDLVGSSQPVARLRLLDGVKRDSRPGARQGLLGRVRRGSSRAQHEPGFPDNPSATPAGAEPRFPGGQPEIWNLPQRNPDFIGRDDLIERLANDLLAGRAGAGVRAEAVHGLGGVGKTQLAIEYAHRHAGDYDLVWWVPAEVPLAIGGHLVALARRLGITDAPAQAETIEALWDELRQRGRWLLLFDDAADAKDLRPYWPPGGDGHVLVTSRNPAWSGLAIALPVDALLRDQSLAFLSNRTGETEDTATLDRLAALLGDLPLVLEQAAAFMEETGSSAGQYLDLLGTHARELFALGRRVSSEQAVAATLRVSLEQLVEEAPAAENLLVLWAFLAADDIPSALPIDHPDFLPEDLAETARDLADYQQTIGALCRYSLITTSGNGLSVQRLLQSAVRHELNDDDQGPQPWATVALSLIETAFPDDSTDPQLWPVCTRLLPHALVVTDHADVLSAEPNTAAWLLAKLGSYLRQHAGSQQARMLYEHAISLAEAHLDPDQPLVAGLLTKLATVTREEGDLDTARMIMGRAHDIYVRQADLGADDLVTAVGLNDLADALREDGDLDTARTLLERALTICETQLGADHPDTAITLHNLASVVQDQGDLDTARTLLKRALTICETRLRPDHPTTEQVRARLATVDTALNSR